MGHVVCISNTNREHAMSLTRFLENSDVRERFRQECKKPTFTADRELLAPPLSNRFSLVGTAFDYLMRFYLKRLNPHAETGTWAAEYALEMLAPSSITSEPAKKPLEKAQRIVERAKEDYADFLQSGQVTDRIITSALRLAQLEPIYRAGWGGADFGRLAKELGNVYKEDVDDLRKLISLVDPELFKASRLCLLNPHFGMASDLVGGADVDLVIDDAIIDIKTTKELRLKREDFNQLIGYLVLHEIAGVGGLNPKPVITKVGIYFSRFGYLHTINVSDVVDRERWPAFVEWFITRAKE
jgi:hypothetical protein